MQQDMPVLEQLAGRTAGETAQTGETQRAAAASVSSTIRPHGTRRAHQRALRRAQRRRRRRRRARLRRLRRLRALRSLRFWTRAGACLAVLAAVTFWARFAVVCDIPPALREGPLAQVRAYVTVKPWWFGPPVFDIRYTLRSFGGDAVVPTTAEVEDALGPYRSVFTDPDIVWAWRTPEP
jgi:hypothetical protein